MSKPEKETAAPFDATAWASFLKGKLFGIGETEADVKDEVDRLHEKVRPGEPASDYDWRFARVRITEIVNG